MAPLIKKKSVIHLVSKNSYPYLTQKRSEFWRVNTIALIGIYPPIRACACNKVEVGITVLITDNSGFLATSFYVGINTIKKDWE